MEKIPAAKQVKKLRNKHRRDIWLDVDGYIWFHHDLLGWQNLWQRETGDWHITAGVETWEVGEYPPYTRIHKGAR